nr:MAG TPA: hypothetical protein [Caudoviricetes sp.]
MSNRAIIFNDEHRTLMFDELKNFIKEKNIGEILYVIQDEFKNFGRFSKTDFNKIDVLTNLKCYLTTLFIGNVCQSSQVDLFLCGNRRIVSDKSVFILEDIHSDNQHADIYTRNRYNYISDQCGIDLKMVMKRLSYQNGNYQKLESVDIMKYNIAHQRVTKEELSDILNQEFIYF